MAIYCKSPKAGPLVRAHRAPGLCQREGAVQWLKDGPRGQTDLGSSLCLLLPGSVILRNYSDFLGFSYLTCKMGVKILAL